MPILSTIYTITGAKIYIDEFLDKKGGNFKIVEKVKSVQDTGVNQNRELIIVRV